MQLTVVSDALLTLQVEARRYPKLTLQVSGLGFKGLGFRV